MRLIEKSRTLMRGRRPEASRIKVRSSTAYTSQSTRTKVRE